MTRKDLFTLPRYLCWRSRTWQSFRLIEGFAQDYLSQSIDTPIPICMRCSVMESNQFLSSFARNYKLKECDKRLCSRLLIQWDARRPNTRHEGKDIAMADQYPRQRDMLTTGSTCYLSLLDGFLNTPPFPSVCSLVDAHRRGAICQRGGDGFSRKVLAVVVGEYIQGDDFAEVGAKVHRDGVVHRVESDAVILFHADFIAGVLAGAVGIVKGSDVGVSGQGGGGEEGDENGLVMHLCEEAWSLNRSFSFPEGFLEDMVVGICGMLDCGCKVISAGLIMDLI